MWAVVVMEAYVSWVSTRKADEKMLALGCKSGSKSKVCRICQAHADQLQAT